MSFERMFLRALSNLKKNIPSSVETIPSRSQKSSKRSKNIVLWKNNDCV